MEQYISKSTLVVEIERRRDICKKVVLDLRTDENKDYYQGKVEAYKETLSFINTLEVKEVQEETESIWHDANEPPTLYRKYLVKYSNGRVSGSWERHDDGFIPWKDVVKEHKFTHWCYTEDLLKL